MMNQSIKTLIKDFVSPFILCIGSAYLIGITPWMQRIENVPLDLITQFRVHYQKPADPRVVTIGIDDSSIEAQAYGRWPWDRKVQGRFMESISFGKPSVVVWDILFTEPSIDPKNDLLIQAGASKLDNRVVFGAFTSETVPQQQVPIAAANKQIEDIRGDLSLLPASGFGVRPIPNLQAVGLTAYVNTPAGQDGVRRSVPMLADSRINLKKFLI